eukprot:1771725-Pleurochrysis_carterae.AAC.3
MSIWRSAGDQKSRSIASMCTGTPVSVLTSTAIAHTRAALGSTIASRRSSCSDFKLFKACGSKQLQRNSTTGQMLEATQHICSLAEHIRQLRR